jgi:hypothetical protein
LRQNRGQINEHEALAAETLAQHFNAARAGQVPMAHFQQALLKSPSNVQGMFNVSHIPAKLVVNG